MSNKKQSYLIQEFKRRISNIYTVLEKKPDDRYLLGAVEGYNNIVISANKQTRDDAQFRLYLADRCMVLDEQEKNDAHYKGKMLAYGEGWRFMYETNRGI